MLAQEARAADAVVNAASSDDRPAIDALLKALSGTGKTLLHTSGSSIVADARIALDHFGTGYSNLYQLGEFQFDKIKIDRRLVEHMEDESNAKLVRALIRLGQGLGLAVSADGIVDQDGRESLLDSGVHEGQNSDASVSGQETLALFAPPRQVSPSGSP